MELLAKYVLSSFLIFSDIFQARPGSSLHVGGAAELIDLLSTRGHVQVVLDMLRKAYYPCLVV
jgi:hypothetical protein